MPDEPKGCKAMALKTNRPYVIRDRRDWLYTGLGFVSSFSSEVKFVIPFAEFGTAERIARHLSTLGAEAFATRSSYDECKRLQSAPIRSLKLGEKISQRRRLGPVDTSLYWPHR